MADAKHAGDLFDVDCPHCHRHFRGKLLTASSPRQAGFKCPHCKLFVAYERATESPQGAD